MQATARPYKEETPVRTVARIRNVLAQHDLLPIESRWYHPRPRAFSVRVEIGAEFGRFGTNGKGVDEKHCLASGYAEFMERLQNEAFLFDTSRRNLVGLHQEFGFHFFPDERLIAEDEFRRLPAAIIGDLLSPEDGQEAAAVAAHYGRLSANGRDSCIAVPFVSLTTGQHGGRPVFVPYDLLLYAAGSNGMTAGNTREEALTVGMFEVMERWGAAEMYHKRLTPPTIPGDCLDGMDIPAEIVHLLEGDGYEVVIKDFSAGIGLPVVGVLAIDRRAGKYKLAVGSDSSFEVAVTRCLTEAYQGIAGAAEFAANLCDLPTDDKNQPGHHDALTAYERQVEFTRFLSNSGGQFPPALFGSRPSYPLDTTPFSPQATFSDEMARWVGHFQKMGVEVLARDVSFLGFPSYHIYVPGVSAGVRARRAVVGEGDVDWMRRLDVAVDRMCAQGDLEVSHLAEIADTLDALPPACRLSDALHLQFERGSDLDKVAVSFYSAAIWYGLRRYDRALASVDRYLAAAAQHTEMDARLDYYLGVRSWVAAKVDGLEAEGAVEKLRGQGFAPELIDTVQTDMADPDTSIADLPMPKCPRCHACLLRESCVSGGKLDLARRVYPALARAVRDG